MGQHNMSDEQLLNTSVCSPGPGRSAFLRIGQRDYLWVRRSQVYIG